MKLSNRHLVLRERSSFVRTNNGRRTERFDCFHPSNNRLVPCHVTHTKRQCDNENNWQPFGNNSDEDGNSSDELLNSNLTHGDRATISKNQLDRYKENGNDKGNESKESTQRLKFQFERCLWCLGLGNIACNSTELRAHPCFSDYAHCTTSCYGCTHVHHVPSIGKKCIDIHWIEMLRDGLRFTGQC